jgi:hypothetical protein
MDQFPIPKAKDLDFKGARAWPPDQKCHGCGRPVIKGVLDRPRYADIQLGPDSHVTLFACSEGCSKTIKQHPRADDYLQGVVEKCRAMDARKEESHE